MSTSFSTGESMPLFLGMTVVTIIVIAFFSSRGGIKKGGKVPAAAAATVTTSKKSRKKKSVSKAKAEKKKAAALEEAHVPEPEPELKTALKKKKKKPKKKGGGGGAAVGTTAPKSDANDSKKMASASDEDEDSDDDDVDLWRIQSAAKRKGANDAAKRAAANKERDRVRALKRQEEKAKASAEAAAAEKARKEAEEAAAAQAAAALAVEEEATAAAAAEEEAKKKAEAEKGKKNGASVNSGDADVSTSEKKKRKRKKKKAAAQEDPAPVLVKPLPPPVEERWEVVPPVEEWQEVGSKRTKQKAKMEAAAAAAAAAAASDAVSESPFLSDEPAEEPGETSATLPAGDDPLIFIGRGGATIQNLQDTTGARFHLDRAMNLLTISGPEDAVQLGLEEARSILAAEAERKANEAEERVTWGSDAIKAVIGRGGANIRAAQEETGTRIDADVEAGTLVIVGPSDQVAEALTMCHNAAFGEVQDVIELGSRNAVNLVYGPAFETIRSLQDDTGCKLDIERGTTTLKLAGSSEAVAEASVCVRALLEANRGFEMTIENSKVGAVYGKGGETLRSIQDRSGTQIDVSRGPTHATVSVMGTVDASARARNMLQRAIDGEVELKPGEVAEEVELGSATAAIIGRGGSNVADLEKKYSVKVNVRSELQKARVVGKPENVAEAVKVIEAIAKPILEAEAAQKKADEALENGESAWQVNPGDDDADGW